MEQYFVSWYLHNKTNDGWAFKVVNRYDSLDAAKKQYHTELSTYISGPTYDLVCVMLTDAYGNVIMKEWWTNYVPPEPNEEA